MNNSTNNGGNMPNIPDDKMNMLISMVSRKMGVAPDTLKQKLENGSFDNILNQLKPEEAEKLNTIANNPNLLNTVLSTPSAKKNLDQIIKGSGK